MTATPNTSGLELPLLPPRSPSSADNERSPTVNAVTVAAQQALHTVVRIDSAGQPSRSLAEVVMGSIEAAEEGYDSDDSEAAEERLLPRVVVMFIECVGTIGLIGSLVMNKEAIAAALSNLADSIVSQL